jgi:hypothetical protein
MKNLHALALLCCFVGCSANKPIARIDDVSVPKELNSGYRVVGVDGGETARARSRFITVVPEVELSAGPHTIQVQRDGEAPIEIKTTFAPNKRYRIAANEGAPTIIEDLR